MFQFSIGSAWSKGIGFFSGKAAGHAILLIGMGLALPIILQFVAMGGAMSVMTPAAMGSGGFEAFLAAGGVVVVLAMQAGYVLQFASYFASWRLGFGEDETLGGAIVFGLVGGLLLFGIFIAVGLVSFVVAQASPEGIALIVFVLLVPIFATFFTVMAALVAFFVLFMMVLTLIVGAASSVLMSEVGPGALGGSVVALIGMALALLLLWLTARFSCVTSVMADRQSYNVLAAINESWRLTAANQWRIIGYLTLLSAVLGVAFIIFFAVISAGMMASMASGGGVPQAGLVTIAAWLIFGIPLVYVLTLVPAGIYRASGGEPVAASVFA